MEVETTALVRASTDARPQHSLPLVYRLPDSIPRDCIKLTRSRIQIRATEDLLTLSRQLKELWLFGGLNTIQEGELTTREEGVAMNQKEEDVKAIVTAVANLLMSRD